MGLHVFFFFFFSGSSSKHGVFFFFDGSKAVNMKPYDWGDQGIKIHLFPANETILGTR